MRRFLSTAAGAAVWALAAGLGAAQLSVSAGVWAAVAGSLLGGWAARGLASSRMRLAALWGAGFLLVVAAGLAALFARGSVLLPGLLGARTAYALGEAAFWGSLAFCAVSALQATSRRKPWFLAVELAAAGAVFVSLFAAHREGFINRPYGLVDPLWGRGYDPLPAFIALGVGVTVLLMVLAVARNRGRRSLLDILLLVGFALALLLVFPSARLKDLIPPGAGSGEKSSEKGQPKKGSASGKEGEQGVGGKEGGPSGDRSGREGQGQPSQQGQGQPEPREGDSGPGDELSSFANQSAGQGNPPVAVVLLHDDYDPPGGYYYFRQTAFSQFNGVRLVQDTTGRADRDLMEAFPTAPVALPASVGDPKLVRALETTVALMVPHTKPFGLVNPVRFAPAPNPDPARFQRAYKVRSLVLSGVLPSGGDLRPGSTRWDDALWDQYTAAPSDPRYAELAQECVRTLKPELRENPLARALAVKGWLEKGGTYSRTSDHEGAPDPLAHFLFGDRTGHCVYFAHSACLLFRTLGMPSRVGAGYAVEARNRGGGDAVLLRERDAHAWPEVYLEGLGWTVLDIAPEKNLDPPEQAPDPGLQQMLGEMARQEPGNPKQDQEPAGGGDLQKALKGVAKAAAAAAGALLLLALLALYGTKLWRRAAPHLCPERELPRVAYRACLDRLADAGILRPFGASREAFARLGPPSPFFEHLTALHLQASLGARRPGGNRPAYLDLAARGSRERSTESPAWRKVIGFLDPFSWLRVK